MASVFTVSCTHRYHLLLPLLEGLRLVEVLHAVKAPAHKLASVFFLMKFSAKSVPEFLKSSKPPSSNHLFVTAAQVERDLGALEPFLHAALSFQEVHVLFQDR